MMKRQIFSISCSLRLKLRSIREPIWFILFFSLLADGAKAASDLEEVRKNLVNIIPEQAKPRVSKSPVPGLFEVVVGTKVFYVTADLEYLLRGELLDVKRKKNITEGVKQDIRAKIFASIEKKNLITFASGNTPKQAEIYIFTDIDCGYCRKLHLEVSELNKAGITVNYLAFPRKGVDSISSEKSQSVWCSSNPKEALTRAKLGKRIKANSCKNPVSEQFRLGVTIGVMGTPAIYSSDGLELGGYLSAEDLKKEILN